MAKKSKIKIHSIQFENDKGELHLATVSKPVKSDEQNAIELAGACSCGDEQCVGGTKYRCFADPFGDCVWWKTTEKC